MQYDEVITYLYDRLPMFTRDGAAAIKKDLTNTLLFCEALDNPHKHFRSIHIAGTNGKGSSSHMLASILQEAGYKTGLYTSPHLLDFRERIRINGMMISKQEVVDFVISNKELIEKIAPSFFEVTVAMAFSHFSKNGVDIAIIETGMGGRLDSTNVVHPLLSLITNIGMDHMNLLGNSLQEIAYEKAGIIKKGVPVVISERQPAVEDVFVTKAEEQGASLVFASDRWSLVDLGTKDQLRGIKVADLSSKAGPIEYELDLMGSYQLKNLCGVLSCVHTLLHLGFNITENHIEQGLTKVQINTKLLGRWQQLGTKPGVICDTGHNHDGWLEVIHNIASTPYQKLHMVIGAMRDKDLDTMLPLLPKKAAYYFCSPNLPRALPSDVLAQAAHRHGLEGVAYASTAQAVGAAQHAAGQEDLIFIGGSTFVVAEALPSFGH